MQSAGKIGRYYNTNREGSAAVDRIIAIFNFFGDSERDSVALDKKKSHETVLRVENVSVTYDGETAELLFMHLMHRHFDFFLLKKIASFLSLWKKELSEVVIQ